MNTTHIPSIAERYLDALFPPGIKCTRFISMVYHEGGLSSDLSFQPTIIDPRTITEDDIGKIVFLMNRNRISHLFNHVAIVYDVDSVIHYSRHMSQDDKRRVQITPWSDLLEVYLIVPNPYISKPLV